MTKEPFIAHSELTNEIYIVIGKEKYCVTEQAIKAVVAIKALEQELQTFKWCTDCREYDQEKHCCHRWSKVIRNTVEEMKQEPKIGHWIKGYTFPDGEYWKCDKCNELIKVKYPMHYCNNCGSDNREVEDGKTD